MYLLYWFCGSQLEIFILSNAPFGDSSADSLHSSSSSLSLLSLWIFPGFFLFFFLVGFGSLELPKNPQSHTDVSTSIYLCNDTFHSSGTPYNPPPHVPSFCAISFLYGYWTPLHIGSIWNLSIKVHDCNCSLFRRYSWTYSGRVWRMDVFFFLCLSKHSFVSNVSLQKLHFCFFMVCIYVCLVFVITFTYNVYFSCFIIRCFISWSLFMNWNWHSVQLNMLSSSLSSWHFMCFSISLTVFQVYPHTGHLGKELLVDLSGGGFIVVLWNIIL